MEKQHKIEIRVLIGIIVILLLGGTFFFHKIENLSLIDSFYTSTMTLTTVGYGDFVPKTNIGKIFTSFYVLFGVGTLLESLSLLAKIRIDKQIGIIKKRKNKK